MSYPIRVDEAVTNALNLNTEPEKRAAITALIYDYAYGKPKASLFLHADHVIRNNFVNGKVIDWLKDLSGLVRRVYEFSIVFMTGTSSAVGQIRIRLQKKVRLIRVLWVPILFMLSGIGS